MKSALVRSLLCLSLVPAAALVGCGEPLPLSITSPAEGSKVTPLEGDTVEVAFTVTDEYRVAPVGECGDDARCGHVHLLLHVVTEKGEHSSTSSPCFPLAAGFHSEGTSSPLTADLSACPEGLGEYDVRVELHDDAHAPLPGAVSIPHRFSLKSDE